MRPHEALADRVPAAFYSRSPRRFHVPAAPVYPEGWLRRQVRTRGWIKFRGSLRFIGRAFVGQLIALEPVLHPGGGSAEEVWNVRLDTLLIGTLHAGDGSPSMRPATFRAPQKWSEKIKATPPPCKPCHGQKV